MLVPYFAASQVNTIGAAPAAGITAVYIGISAVSAVLTVIAVWKLFTKAGKPGWHAIIPVYNSIELFKMASISPWYILLLLVPFVGIGVGFYFAIKLAAAFGKSPVFGVIGLGFFSIVGLFILAFGNATYIGPNGMMPTATPPTTPGPSYPPNGTVASTFTAPAPQPGMITPTMPPAPAMPTPMSPPVSTPPLVQPTPMAPQQEQPLPPTTPPSTV